MKRPSLVALLVVVAGPPAIGAAACRGRIEPVGAVDAEDGGDRHDSSGALDAQGADVRPPPRPPLFCRLVGTECVGAPVCCPYRGFLVDVDAGCRAKAPLVIGCWRDGYEVGECAGTDDARCVYRDTDAGREIFWTGENYDLDGMPGGRPCDGETEQKVLGDWSTKRCP